MGRIHPHACQFSSKLKAETFQKNRGKTHHHTLKNPRVILRYMESPTCHPTGFCPCSNHQAEPKGSTWWHWKLSQGGRIPFTHRQLSLLPLHLLTACCLRLPLPRTGNSSSRSTGNSHRRGCPAALVIKESLTVPPARHFPLPSRLSMLQTAQGLGRAYSGHSVGAAVGRSKVT